MQTAGIDCERELRALAERAQELLEKFGKTLFIDPRDECGYQVTLHLIVSSDITPSYYIATARKGLSPEPGGWVGKIRRRFLGTTFFAESTSPERALVEIKRKIDQKILRRMEQERTLKKIIRFK